MQKNILECSTYCRSCNFIWRQIKIIKHEPLSGQSVISWNHALVQGLNKVTCLGFEQKSHVSVPLDVGSVEGLAYHRAWDTLYWTSSTTSTITRQTVDHQRVGALKRQAVVTLSEEDHPHVLALDECQKSVALRLLNLFCSLSLFTKLYHELIRKAQT